MAEEKPKINKKHLDLFFDVDVNVSVRMKEKDMKLRDVARLTKGGIIELEMEPDDKLDIYVNDKLIGHGDIVMVNGRLAARVTDIVSLRERFKKQLI